MRNRGCPTFTPTRNKHTLLVPGQHNGRNGEKTISSSTSDPKRLSKILQKHSEYTEVLGSSHRPWLETLKSKIGLCPLPPALAVERGNATSHFAQHCLFCESVQTTIFSYYLSIPFSTKFASVYSCLPHTPISTTFKHGPTEKLIYKMVFE